MKKYSHITGFYLETLILITVFVSIIHVLTQVFGLAQLQSTRARQLTGAVALAGNAAEAVSASISEEELLQLLNENDNAAPMSDGAGVTARYDSNLRPDAGGTYRVDVTWTPEETGQGTMIHSTIRVCCGETEDPVYDLETESFRLEVIA